MIIEINYFTVAMLAAIASALVSAFWMIGRTFLQQYGSMLNDQLATHRMNEARNAEVVARRLDDLENLAERGLSGQAERIARLEHAATKAPTHDDLGKLYERINDIDRVVSQIVGELKGISATLRLIQSRVIHDRRGSGEVQS